MLKRFTGLFQQTRKRNSALDEQFQLGVGEEEDIATLMRIFPLMEPTMGISLEALEEVHKLKNTGSDYDRVAGIAIERLKATRSSQ